MTPGEQIIQYEKSDDVNGMDHVVPWQVQH